LLTKDEARRIAANMLTPHYVARAIGKAAPTDIRNYAEQNADKLKAIATSEKARGLTTHTLE
jgi:hypothetical protein